MLVHNKGDYVRNYRGVRLIPGVNKISDEEWKTFASHPLNQKLVDAGEIVPQITDSAAGAQVSKKLADLNASEAAALIGDTFDLKLLDELETEENAGQSRKTVLAAIEKQRADIEKSIEDAKKKAEGNDD